MREILLRTWRPTSLDSTGNLHRNFRCNRNFRLGSEPEFPVGRRQEEKWLRTKWFFSLVPTGSFGRNFRFSFEPEPEYPIANGQKTVRFVKRYIQASYSLSPPLLQASLTSISLYNHSNTLKVGESKEKAKIYKLTKAI